MTKDELLKLIEEYGEFWFISCHYCTGYPHGDNLLWFDKEKASNIGKYDELINLCITNPELIQIDSDNKRLFLLKQTYYDFHNVGVLKPSKKCKNGTRDLNVEV